MSNNLDKRRVNEFKLKIELEKCKNEIDEKKRNEHELESQLKEHKSSQELDDGLKKMTK